MISELETKFIEVCDIVNGTIGLVDENNMIFLCNDKLKVGTEVNLKDDILCKERNLIYKDIVYSNENFEFVNGYIFLETKDANGKQLLEIINLYLFENRGRSNVFEKYLEFFKQLFMNNWDDETIRNKVIANRIQLAWDPVLVLFKCDDITPDVFTLISQVMNEYLYGIVPISDEELVILVEAELGSVKECANLIVADLEQELFIKSKIIVSDKCANIVELNRAYKYAKEMTYLMPKVFKNTSVLSYDDLAIERLFLSANSYSLKKFAEDFLPSNIYSEINKDLLTVIDAMLEYNLNISEAARQTYIHRNTLVYRIDRIKKLTGLNICNFEDAVILKLSLGAQMYLHEKLAKEQKADD